MTKAYKRVLDSLMSSVHRLEVDQEYSFERREYSDDGKRQVTPAEMVRCWLNLRTFGVPNPRIKELIHPLVRAFASTHVCD